MAMNQPLTAKQIARKTGIPMDTCSYTIAKLTARGLLTCLNPKAMNSRLYWITELGRQCRKQLYQDKNLPYKEYDLPSVNWPLYGWLCYSHRAAVIRFLTEPMQPSAIKRTLRIYKPNVKISANNIRDVVRLLLEKGIVQKVFVRKKAHPRYELTEVGHKLRQLLIQSEMSF
ncbi:MAG: hypothetical protein DRP65_00845 [Planctomycetota bacterium]|nr:MAG: hypothetical protein DRP65_00845 [Planctomycetota bacterium]